VRDGWTGIHSVRAWLSRTPVRYRVQHNVGGQAACARNCGYPVLCENSAHGLRGLAVVELEHAAEPLTALNWACSRQHCLRPDTLVAQTLVWPFLVITAARRCASPSGTIRSKHSDLMDETNHSGKRVQIWTPRWQESPADRAPRQQRYALALGEEVRPAHHGRGAGDWHR
jgi:hypothetical protein